MTTTRKLWIAWFFLVFGLFNIFGPRWESYRRPSDPPDVSLTTIMGRLDDWQCLGVLTSDSGDTERYFAYANAMLGRPYTAAYVRKAGDSQAMKAAAGTAPYFIHVTPARPLLPWRDFAVEYPPGMLIFALAPALLTHNFALYHLLFSIEMGLLLTLSVFVAVRAMERVAPGQGQRTLEFALATTLALGFIATRRYDACVSLSLGLTLFALAARRPAGAGAALAFGVIAKGAPILFAPLGVFYYATARRWRALLVSLAAAALLCLVACGGYLWLAGAHWGDAFAYHADRPLQVESTFSALLIFLQIFDPHLISHAVYTFGSLNIVSPYEPLLRPVAEAAPILAMAACAFWTWRALSRQKVGDLDRLVILAKSACAIIIAFSVLGKVFSPQYLVWLTPVAAIASLRAAPKTTIWLFVGLGLSQLEYPYLYTFLASSLTPFFGLVVLLRNGALLIWATKLLLAAPERVADEAALASAAQAPAA